MLNSSDDNKNNKFEGESDVITAPVTPDTPDESGMNHDAENNCDHHKDDMNASAEKKRNMPIWLKYTLRTFAVIAVTVALLIFALLGVMFVLAKGPSPTAQRLFVLSVKETSAAGFLANIYLSQEEIDEITASDFSMEKENAVDTGLININTGTSDADTDDLKNETNNADSEKLPEMSPVDEAHNEEPDSEQLTGIRVDDVIGATYKGKMMVVSDSSRIMVGIPDEFGEGRSGLTVMEMIDKYGCTGGINAGGFYDPNGTGTGGIPDGVVIYNGELKWGELYKSYSVIGFDKNKILHVGTMTAADALARGVEEAVSFGPALIINGVPCNQNRPLGGGINPRTAIGQCADGTMLLLVINGRQIDSLGATFDDVVEIMLSYGAVNASNLDGGSSSIMVYNKEYVTSSAYLFGERKIASSILVK